MILLIVGVAGLLVILGVLIYWQLVVVEGAYLGQGVVTYLYDITAKRYDKIKAYLPDMEVLFLGEPLAGMLADLDKPAVIDIGTGTGRLPLALFKQSSFNGDIVGIDASRPMLEQAYVKLTEYENRSILIWKNAASIPFPDATFDAVTCLEMTEFTVDPVGQLREGVRVLKPGGVFLTSRRRGMDARLMPGKTFSTDAFSDVLKSLGLRDIRIDPWQVDYDLVSSYKSGLLNSDTISPRQQTQCVTCGQQTLNWRQAKVVCTKCGEQYDFKAGILFMNHEERRAR